MLIKAINYICSDSFSLKNFSVHFRAINHQIVDKRIKQNLLFKRRRKSSNIWIQIWRTDLNPALNDSALVLKCNRLNKNQLQKIFIGKVIQIAASWCEVWTREFFAGWETEANSKNSRKTQSPIKNNNHEVTIYFRVLPCTSWTGIWKYK